MNPILRQMVELTEIDHQIVATREQLEHYPALLAKMQRAHRDVAGALEAARADQAAALKARRAAEQEVQTLRTQSAANQRRLSEVKTNKEYEAVQQQIALLAEKIDQAETAGLEHLEAEEAAALKIGERAKTLETLEAEQAKEHARIEQQQAEKTARLISLDEERRVVLAGLDESWREQYEELNGRYPGQACAPLEGSTCGGCNWGMVAHIGQHVREGSEPVRCNHCRRFLFIKERG